MNDVFRMPYFLIEFHFWTTAVQGTSTTCQVTLVFTSPMINTRMGYIDVLILCYRNNSFRLPYFLIEFHSWTMADQGTYSRYQVIFVPVPMIITRMGYIDILVMCYRNNSFKLPYFLIEFNFWTMAVQGTFTRRQVTLVIYKSHDCY
jgi:predicted ABC-type sugar transport system permease subunit